MRWEEGQVYGPCHQSNVWPTSWVRKEIKSQDMKGSSTCMANVKQ